MTRGKNWAKRAEITARVVAKFSGRAFDWASGATCLHLAREQARQMGHRGLPRIPALAGPADALRALQAQGAGSLAELLDQHFERLPAPAFARVGDLVMAERPDGMPESVGIADGTGNVFGWHDTDEGGLKPLKNVAAHLTAGWKL